MQELLTFGEHARSDNGSGVAEPRIVLILGSQRSGSTLLSEIIGGASDSSSIGEAFLTWRGLVRDETCSCGQAASKCDVWSTTARSLGYPDNTGAAAHWMGEVAKLGRLRRLASLDKDFKVGPGTAHARLAAEYRRLYLACADARKAKLLVDSSKTPSALPLALATGLRVDVIHLVRDPRAVAYSENKPLKPDMDPVILPERRSIVESATLWLLQNHLVRRIVAASSALKWHTLRYEDLVSNPRPSLQELAAALELPSQDWPIGAGQPWSLDLVNQHILVGNPGRFNRRRELRADDRWRRELPKPARIFVEASCRRQMRRLGYERAN